MEQKLESWFAISKLKYYFAVDNSYVGKKLALLLFPYAQRYVSESDFFRRWKKYTVYALNYSTTLTTLTVIGRCLDGRTDGRTDTPCNRERI